MRYTLLLGLLVAGCSKTAAVVPTVAPPPAAPSSAVVNGNGQKEDAASAFLAKVAHYLSEARAGAKLMTLRPSAADARDKAKHITDLYTRLPEPPPGTNPIVATRLEQLNRAFGLAAATASQGEDALRRKHDDLAKQVYETDMPRAAKTILWFVDEIEKALKLPET